MDLEARFHDWLSSGGAYFILFGSWIILIIVFGRVAPGIAKRRGGDSEGCVLQIATTVMVLTGGALGLLATAYPKNIVTSILGAIILPLIIIQVFLRKKATY